MAATHANSKHYDKMAPKMDSDSHLGANASAPKAMPFGRSGGKADRTMAPKTTVGPKKFGK